MQHGMTRLIAASAALVLTAGVAQAETVIYQDDFSGGAVALDGTTPDIGANNWIAAPTFSANGSVADSIGASATLAFAPVDGLVYTLDASFRNFANPGTAAATENDWLAVGFANGQSTATGNGPRFAGGSALGNPVPGLAWSFVRGGTTASVGNNAWLGTVANGAPTGNNTVWSDPTLAAAYASDLDLRIVLDTTGGTGNWTATWYAKAAADATYTEVRATATLLDENINSVGISRSNPGFTADVTYFSLTSVPEPSSLALLGLGGLLIARRRRN